MLRLILPILFFLNLSIQAQTGPDAQSPESQKLIHAEMVWGISSTTEIPEEIQALQSLMSLPDAEHELVKVYRYGAIPGKVYALIGLQAIGSNLFQTFKTDFNRKDSGNMRVQLPDVPEQLLNARDFFGQWELDAIAGKSYTLVKP